MPSASSGQCGQASPFVDGEIAWPTESIGRPLCDMTALSLAERSRYDTLRQRVLNGVDEVRGSATAFRLRLRHDASPSDVAEWMALEHRCCPFLTLQLALKADGTTWVDIGGSSAIKVS